MTDPGEVSILRVFVAFFFVLALMAGLAGALKYIGARGFSLSAQGKRIRRLKLIESLPLDPKRRCVIIRCDEKEHLLLLSAQGDSVIETNLPPVKEIPPDDAPHS